MAQGRVTKYFTLSKSVLNPSKRRKVTESTADESLTLESNKDDFKKAQSVPVESALSKLKSTSNSGSRGRGSKTSARAPRNSLKKPAKTSATSATGKQTKITDAFSQKVNDTESYSQTTSTWDEHDGPASAAGANEKTPSRRRRRDIIVEEPSTESASKPRTISAAVRRLGKASTDATTRAKAESVNDDVGKSDSSKGPPSARKRLWILPGETKTEMPSDGGLAQSELTPLPEEVRTILKEVAVESKAISPLHPTPTREPSPTEDVPSVPTSPGVKAAMKKCKELLTPSKTRKHGEGEGSDRHRGSMEGRGNASDRHRGSMEGRGNASDRKGGKNGRQEDNPCLSSPTKMSKVSPGDDGTDACGSSFAVPTPVSASKTGEAELRSKQLANSPAKRSLFPDNNTGKSVSGVGKSPMKKHDPLKETGEVKEAQPVQSPLKNAKAFYGKEDIASSKFLTSPSKRMSPLEASIRNSLASPTKVPRLLDGTSASPRRPVMASPDKSAESETSAGRRKIFGQTAMSTQDEPNDSSKKSVAETDSLKTPKSSGSKSGPAASEKVIPAEELKRRLQKQGKMADARKQLRDLKASLAATKQSKSQTSTATAGGEESTPRTEEESSPAPAYERFASLATPPPPALTLPLRYRQLAESFSSLDVAASMLHNRQETSAFPKLKAAVQQMTRRNFEEKTVGQIKTVYPDAFILQQEKRHYCKKKEYELTISPDLVKTEALMQRLGQSVSKQPENGLRKFLPGHLSFRKTIFHRCLLNITKQHHKEFLEKLPVPVKVPQKSVTRWHPQFKLDQVPEIPPAPLPTPPEVKVCQSATQFLQETQGKHRPKVQEALEKLAIAEEADPSPKSKSNSPTPPASTPSPSPAIDSAKFKGIPLSLLQRIQAKEAKKIADALTRDPAEDRKTAMISQLPEFARIIRSYFVSEKKPALPWTQLVEKLTDSCDTSISSGDVDSHLKLLLELVPYWISVVNVKAGRYLKIDRNIDIQELGKKFANMAKSRT